MVKLSTSGEASFPSFQPSGITVSWSLYVDLEVKLSKPQPNLNLTLPNLGLGFTLK